MLNLARDINSLSNFKRATPKFLEQLRETKAPIVLTLNGVSEIVVQSAEGYQDLLDRLDYLELRETIRIGFQDIREGKSFPTFPALEDLQKNFSRN